MKLLAAITALFVGTTALDPPVWPETFTEAFDETFVENGFNYHVNGVMYYDAAHNRSRYDRVNGQFDKFCNSLVPNITTPCTNLVTGGKRYIVFPLKSQCCECCTSEKGCGILKPNWLEGAEYLGTEMVDGIALNKWNKPGVIGYNYYWATNDTAQLPRRIDESGAHIIDFNIHSFKNTTIEDRVFSVPSYCQSTCPLTSFCGKFRSENPEAVLAEE